MTAISDFLRSLAPSYRLAMEKRHLEAVMRHHGINRKLAARITNHFYKTKP